MKQEHTSVLATNLDDMSGEEISYLLELMMDKGAVDAWAAPVMTGRHNPAYRVCVQCKKEDTARLGELLLLNSTAVSVTLEVRHRLMLDEEVVYLETSLGMVRIARAGAGRHIVHEDLARIAKKHGISIAAAKEKILEEIDL
ncbi:LarC family nickel insertion protein [Christensenellaceae bacterium OttesenSCG-928-K19]|nr:LarC family nickel insertion protein [Christensenellaceae bacterium OttesenSCG-928-K19]